MIKAKKCQRCEGCGQIANDDEGSPWKRWAALPLESAVAVQMGVIHPVPCPDCGGTGEAQPDGQKEKTMKYRKKPIVVEAFQMTPTRRWDNSEWPDWLHEAWQRDHGEGAVWPDPDVPPAVGHESANELVIGTLEGVMRLLLNGWIIRGIQLELYPCKPEIFEATYDVATERHFKARSTNEQVQQAIKIVQESIDSHETWRDYRKEDGQGDAECGDLAFHEECLNDYAQVMEVLRSIHPEGEDHETQD